MSQSDCAIIRCRSSGVMWKESPGFNSVETSASPSPPVWKSISPERRWTVSSLRMWYCRLKAWPLLMWRILPTYRPVWAQISSYPQGFSTRTGLMAGMSAGGHHHGSGTKLALDVRAEPVGGIAARKGADPDAGPGALGAQVRLHHVGLEAGSARAGLDARGLGPVPRSPHLDRECAQVARRGREHGRRRRDLRGPRRRGHHGGLARRRGDQRRDAHLLVPLRDLERPGGGRLRTLLLAGLRVERREISLAGRRRRGREPLAEQDSHGEDAAEQQQRAGPERDHLPVIE